MSYRLLYVDSLGRTTTRDVTMVATGSLSAFVARCHMRQSLRTFLYDRVQEAIDLDTGEILTGHELLDNVKGLHDSRTHVA